MDLIGHFAGDFNRRLEFTITPIRKYMGNIRVHSPYRSYTLIKSDWTPKQFTTELDVDRLRCCIKTRMLQRYYRIEPWMSDFTKIMDKFQSHMLEIQDFSLR